MGIQNSGIGTYVDFANDTTPDLLLDSDSAIHSYTVYKKYIYNYWLQALILFSRFTATGQFLSTGSSDGTGLVYVRSEQVC